jgi:RNA polymerase sigma-70 factor (ECF subfamily)
MTGTGFDDVLARLGRGETAAANELYTAYSAYVRAVVRRRLSAHLRAKFDSADVAQSVWAQVVRRVGAGWQVGSEPELRAVLAVIARRRLATRVRTHSRPAERTSATALDGVPAPSSTSPSQVAHAQELWDRLLQLCPSEHRDVLRLRREGMPLAEVAARTGLHEGSVRRILRRLFREVAGGEPAAPAVPEPLSGA